MEKLCRCCNVLLKHSLKARSTQLLVPRAGYKSQYSFDKVFPNSRSEFLSENPNSSKLKGDKETFSGWIPLDRLEVKYSKSGGPGGQHVNKVQTQVEMRFHVETADWIPEATRQRLMTTERGKINKTGHLIVSSDRTRKQLLNQADCLDKIRNMIFQAGKTPAQPTQEDFDILRKRKDKAREGLIKEKRRQSFIKESRGAQ